MEPGLYYNENLKAVRRRVPAGGAGGGLTSMADEAVDAYEAKAWLTAHRPDLLPAEPEKTADDAAAHPADAAKPA